MAGGGLGRAARLCRIAARGGARLHGSRGEIEAERRGGMNGWQGVGLRWMQWRERWGLQARGLPLLVLALLLGGLQLALGAYWSREPAPFAVAAPADAPPGAVLTGALLRVQQALTDKPGGYLRNDVLPPGSLLDDLPAWELGVLGQVRTAAAQLRQGMGRPSPGAEDADLAAAETAFRTDAGAWLAPSAEQAFGQGAQALARYAQRLQAGGDARFTAQGVYLVQWLAAIDARLALLAARLNAALPAHAEALATGPVLARTPWRQIDDVFYEARGSAWALLHLLKAAELEFAPALAERHADLGLRAAIHELEATQQPLWSPMVLNGSGFGLFANHSLVMANYLHRARMDLAQVQRLLIAH